MHCEHRECSTRKNILAGGSDHHPHGKREALVQTSNIKIVRGENTHRSPWNGDGIGKFSLDYKNFLVSSNEFYIQFFILANVDL